MKKKSTTNTFENGLVMDFNPLIQPLGTLSNALNATLITMNGNENMLLNDMGNGRVESAYLPEGYVPVGTCSFGGVIYIASYNPFTKKCQIGSFPSPERNITSSEVNDSTDAINETSFYSDTTPHNPNNPNVLSSPCTRILVYETPLNPGDKYLIVSADVLNSYILDSSGKNCSYISALGQSKYFNYKLLPRYVRIAPISIGSNGSYTDLSDTCVWQPFNTEGGQKLINEGYYYLYTSSDVLNLESENLDIDEYRDLISSNYNVFSSEYSGLLGILAELECIDTFSAAWDAYKTYGDNGEEVWNFYFFLNWTYDNDMSPDKINLYGVHVDGTVSSEETDDTNIDDANTVSSTNARKVAVYRAAVEKEDATDPGLLIINQYPYHIPQSWVVTGPGAQLEEGGGLLELADVIDPENPENPLEPVAMYGVFLGNTDIMLYLDYIKDDDYVITFLNPPYIDSLYEAISNDKGLSIEKYIEKKYSDADENDFRKNNGSDNLYLLSTPFLITDTTGILTMDVTPTMPYGEMAWLKQSFRIDLDKLGTGDIELCTYKYYVDNNTITLQWGLDAYVEMNRKILGVDIDFFIIDENVADWLNQLVGEYYDGEVDPDHQHPEYIGHIDNHKGMIKDDVSNWVEMSDFPSAALSPNGYDYTPVDKKVTDIQKAEPISHYNWSSYSGNFTETLTFNDLTQYTTYLVRIRVDYDGDYIDFYRIMYTEPIFNNYYYKTEYPDFAAIKLSDVTSFTFNTLVISLNNTTTSYSAYEVTTEEVEGKEQTVETAITKIPSYITDDEYNELDDDKIKNYCVHCEYSELNKKLEILGNLVYKEKVVSNSFNISLGMQGVVFDDISSIGDVVTFDDSDASLTSWYASGVTSSYAFNTNSIDNEVTSMYPSVEENSNILTLSYDVVTHCPTSIKWGYVELLPISKKFEKLEVVSGWLMGTGDKNSANLEYGWDESPRIKDTTVYPFTSDDLSLLISVYGATDLKAQIKEQLQSADVVCIGCGLYSYAYTPGGKWQMTLSSGTGEFLHLGGSHGWYAIQHSYLWRSDYCGYFSKAKDKGYFLLIYGIKDAGNNIILYTYGVIATEDQYLKVWDGVSIAEPESDTHKLYDYDFYPTTNFCRPELWMRCPSFKFSEASLTSNFMEFPFNSIYKLKDTNETLAAHEYSVIQYYPRFQHIEVFTIKCTLSSIYVYINNYVDILLEELQYINNFQCKSPESCEVIYTNNRIINIDNIIDGVTNKSDQTFVCYEDDNGDLKIISAEMDSSLMYKKDGDTFLELSTILNINQLPYDNAIKIRCNNGYMYTSGGYSSLDTINIGFAFEEQAIGLRGIYIIPYSE